MAKELAGLCYLTPTSGPLIANRIKGLPREKQRGRIAARVKYWKTALAILAALFASIALADDFKTNDGKEYKNATVTRVEADGIVVRTKGGIIKLYFPELPQDVQERFHYDPEKAAAAQAAAASARRSGSLMKIGATSFSQDLVLELHSSLSVERQMRTHFARMSQG